MKVTHELPWSRRIRLDLEISKIPTAELEALLSPNTVYKIERKEPVRYRSAALYCKALGLDPYQTIIVERKIPIIEKITEEVTQQLAGDVPA